MKLILFIAMILSSFPAVAQTIGEVTKLPLPRFASIRSDKTYARTGPATRYPIKWIYQKNNLPVEIIQEFDTWRKIRDIDGEEGWIHQSLLSGKRFGIVKVDESVPLLRSNNDESKPVALVESGALLAIDSCIDAWCEVDASGYDGWIQADSLWGVYDREEIK